MPYPLVGRVGIVAIVIGSAAFADTGPPAGSEQRKSSAWWLGRAVDYAGRIEDVEARSHGHKMLAYALAHHGDFARALRAASEVIGPQIRVYAFGQIARRAHAGGDAAACEEALGITRESARIAANGHVHGYIIRLYFELERPDEAVTFAATVSDALQRRYAYRTVAEEMAKVGRIDEAIELIGRHTPAAWRDSGHASLARACATASRFDQAIELAERIEEPKYGDSAYDYIAEKLIAAKRLDEAMTIAMRIDDERRRAERLACQLAASVKPEEGVSSTESAMAEAVGREDRIAVGMLRLSELINQREVEKAEALIASLVQTIRDSRREPQVTKFGTYDDSLQIATIEGRYMDVARLLKEAGDEAAARQRVAKAIAAAEAIPSPGLGKMMLCAQLIREQAALGDPEGARASTRLLDTDLELSNSKGDVAAAYILAGEVDEGLALAREVVHEEHYAHGTRLAATALIEVKRFDELAEYLPLIPDRGHDVRTFRAIAKELVKAGEVERLDRLLGILPSAAARTQACLGAYDALRAK
jgi:hypothetical protein